MDSVDKIVGELASIPTVLSAQFTRNVKEFEATLNIRKYFNETTKKTNYLVHSDAPLNLIEQSADIKFRSYSPNGSTMIVGRSESKSPSDPKQTIILEIWTNSVITNSLSLSNLHSTFCLDEVFGCLAWSPSGNQFMYVAERKVDDPKGFEKFALQECFGEKLSNIHEPVICILNINTEEVKVLNLSIPQDIVLSQPVFATEDYIYFTGIQCGSKKLGMTYIYCRPSAIYGCSLLSLDVERISDENRSSRSPIVSEDGTKVVYLSNSQGGSHFKCSQLISYDSKSKQTEIIVDIVDDPNCCFPGIFAQRLPLQRFKKDVFLSSCWFNDRPIIRVNLENGHVHRLFDDLDGSFRIFDCRGEHLLLLRSTPINPGEIFIYDSDTKFSPNFDFEVIQQHSGTCKISDQIVYETTQLNQQVTAVLIKPKQTQNTGPLIVLPHGGPNSVYSIDYILYPIVLAMMGYTVASINYAGSIGFGDNSIKALEGNIGCRDVEDCFLCTEMLLKTGQFDRSRVWIMGGSHGGYLGAHLSAKYPDLFCGAILRNPVIDLPSMLVTSDIVDWTFGQLGLDYNQLKSRGPTEAELKLMRERSPSSYFQGVRCPTLVMLGAQDLRVHPSQGLFWGNLLKGNGVHVEVYHYPDANHGLETADSERFGLLKIINFLQSNQ